MALELSKVMYEKRGHLAYVTINNKPFPRIEERDGTALLTMTSHRVRPPS